MDEYVEMGFCTAFATLPMTSTTICYYQSWFESTFNDNANNLSEQECMYGTTADVRKQTMVDFWDKRRPSPNPPTSKPVQPLKP